MLPITVISTPGGDEVLNFVAVRPPRLPGLNWGIDLGDTSVDVQPTTDEMLSTGCVTQAVDLRQDGDVITVNTVPAEMPWSLFTGALVLWRIKAPLTVPLWSTARIIKTAYNSDSATLLFTLSHNQYATAIYRGGGVLLLWDGKLRILRFDPSYTFRDDE